MPEGASWVRIEGDGVAVQGRCLLLGLVFWPDVAADYVDVYDGLDATAGKKFCRVEADVDETIPVQFPAPVEFASGIYVDGIDSAVETTVIFQLLD